MEACVLKLLGTMPALLPVDCRASQCPATRYKSRFGRAANQLEEDEAVRAFDLGGASWDLIHMHEERLVCKALLILASVALACPSATSSRLPREPSPTYPAII